MAGDTIDITLLKDEDKVHFLSSTMHREAFKIIAKLMGGRKDVNNLGCCLTKKDLLKPPFTPRLQVNHFELSKLLTETFYQNENVKKLDRNNITLTFPPVIQSGGYYTLSLDCQNDQHDFKDDVIIINVGIKYKNYCSFLVRTHIFSPEINNKLENNYKLLYKLQFFIFYCLRENSNLGDVYDKAIEFVAKKRPHMVKHLTDNFGGVIGMGSQADSYKIKKNSNAIAKEKMVFFVNVGFEGLEDSNLMEQPPHKYALWIGDCVVVHKDKPATLLKYVSSQVNRMIIHQPRLMGSNVSMQKMPLF